MPGDDQLDIIPLKTRDSMQKHIHAFILVHTAECMVFSENRFPLFGIMH